MTIGSADIDSESWLLCRVGPRLCALPLENVVETMRLLPIAPVADAPPSVLGLCIVRGSPVPVVDLRAVLAEPAARLHRMVTLRIGGGTVVVAVESVVGVRQIGSDEIDRLPPLLGEAAGDIVSGIGTLDSELLLFLRAARMVPVTLPCHPGSHEAA
jgi:purine-binding chemotaxis protein CheW